MLLSRSLVTATVAVAVVGLAVPASAETTGATVLATIDRAAPASTPAAGSLVELPDRPGQPITMTGVAGAETLGLPTAPGSRPELSTSDAKAFDDPSGDFAVVAQKSGRGARGLVIIDNDRAPTEYRFPLGLAAGVRPHLASDGGVDLLAEGKGATALVGRIEPAWAKGSDGRSVPTRYTLDRDTLVQTVDHRGAAYPVVADPNMTDCSWYGECTTYFTRSYTRNTLKPAVDGGGAGVIGAITAACTLAGGPVGALACGAVGGLSLAEAMASINIAVAQNKCAALVRPLVPPAYVRVDDSGFCKDS